MLNSNNKRVTFGCGDTENDITSEMFSQNGSQASHITSTDSELSTSAGSHQLLYPDNNVRNPCLWFKGTEGKKKRGLKLAKESSNFGLYAPVPFNNEKDGTVECFFFVFDNEKKKFFGPGTKFTGYVDPVGKGILCICLFDRRY